MVSPPLDDHAMHGATDLLRPPISGSFDLLPSDSVRRPGSTGAPVGGLASQPKGRRCCAATAGGSED